jgi:uncharacterized alpha-E superfamily protein
MELAQYKSILTYHHEESAEFQLLEAVLVSNQNLSSYRSVYRTSLNVVPVIDLLFVNSQNPTSILSQLEGLLKYAKGLAQKSGSTDDNEISRLAFEAYSQVRLMDIDKLVEAGKETGYRKGLDEFCEVLQNQISAIAIKLSSTYFSHTTYQSQSSKDGFQFEV